MDSSRAVSLACGKFPTALHGGSFAPASELKTGAVIAYQYGTGPVTVVGTLAAVVVIPLIPTSAAAADVPDPLAPGPHRVFETAYTLGDTAFSSRRTSPVRSS